MMNKEQFNQTVASNIAKYRKRAGLTQLALAEKLNYTDKAVAKWESGESLPDAYVLSQIAQEFGITLNDLTTQRKHLKTPVNRLRAFFVPALSCCCVWLVALIAFLALITIEPNPEKPWLCFIVAIPVTFIITLVFACVYKSPIIQLISITGIIWTTFLTLHLFLINVFPMVKYSYVAGIPIQIAFILGYAYYFIIKSKNKKA